MIVLFKEIVDLKVPRSLALCHSNCLKTRFPFEYTQINITLTHTHPHTRCIIYVKELSVRLSAVSTNDAYEYERKMGVFAFNLRGMRLCTLAIMGTDVSSVAYSHNSIQFDSVRHDSPSVWVDLISISIAILLFSISNQNSQSVSRGRKANPHALYLYCLCVCVNDSALKNRSL